jgi:hypothetical protein
MHRGWQYLGSVLLTAALAAPGALIVGAPAFAVGQEREEHHDRDDRRVYDPDHRDYHNWDDREDRAYREWLEGRHKAYREYSKLKRKEQREYWDWRHSHEEHEEHEHH